jgi:hypothetical protein
MLNLKAATRTFFAVAAFPHWGADDFGQEAFQGQAHALMLVGQR